MCILNLLSLFDTLCVHDAIFLHDEVVEGTSSIDPIRLLELFSVREPVEKEEELRVLVGLVDRASKLLHPRLNLTHVLFSLQDRSGVEGIAHVHY